MSWFRRAGQRMDSFWFGMVDARAYVLLRISFATVALLNLVNLWPDRHAFFAESGIIDQAATREYIAGQPRFSLFLVADSEAMVTVTMLIAAAALISLALGIFPRGSAIVAYLWHLSYTYRAFPIIHGWDVILRILAFVIMISPTGRCWRVAMPGPARPTRKQQGAGTQPVRGREKLPRYGIVLVQLQLAVIYWQTVWLKLDDTFWRNGEFISYFMMSMYSRFSSRLWAEWQTLSCLLTYGTLLAEILIPVLLYFRRTRWLGFLTGFGLHLGILVLSKIWLFSLVILVLYCAFLDEDDFSRIAQRIRSLRPRRSRQPETR